MVGCESGSFDEESAATEIVMLLIFPSFDFWESFTLILMRLVTIEMFTFFTLHVNMYLILASWLHMYW